MNGAGKTTTLSILSGDIRPTKGEAFINGYSVIQNLAAAQKQIGYCPQFNPLLDLMTAREHLHMYANLKGVPKHDVKQVVNTLVQAVGLQKYVDRVSGAYSGGNKRKLALAIALVHCIIYIPACCYYLGINLFFHLVSHRWDIQARLWPISFFNGDEVDVCYSDTFFSASTSSSI